MQDKIVYKIQFQYTYIMLLIVLIILVRDILFSFIIIVVLLVYPVVVFFIKGYPIEINLLLSEKKIIIKQNKFFKKIERSYNLGNIKYFYKNKMAGGAVMFNHLQIYDDDIKIVDTDTFIIRFSEEQIKHLVSKLKELGVKGENTVSN